MQNDWNEKKKEEEEIGTKLVFNRASISRVSINNPLIDRTSIYPTVFILKKKSIAIFLFLSLSLLFDIEICPRTTERKSSTLNLPH